LAHLLKSRHAVQQATLPTPSKPKRFVVLEERAVQRGREALQRGTLAPSSDRLVYTEQRESITEQGRCQNGSRDRSVRRAPPPDMIEARDAVFGWAVLRATLIGNQGAAFDV
jgi:hypothetical protein